MDKAPVVPRIILGIAWGLMLLVIMCLTPIPLHVRLHLILVFLFTGYVVIKSLD